MIIELLNSLKFDQKVLKSICLRGNCRIIYTDKGKVSFATWKKNEHLQCLKLLTKADSKVDVTLDPIEIKFDRKRNNNCA